MWRKISSQTLLFLPIGMLLWWPSSWAQSPLPERSAGMIVLTQDLGVFSVVLAEAEFGAVIREVERLTGAEVVIVGAVDRTMRASTEFKDKELWRGIKRLFEVYRLKGVLIVGSQTQIRKIYLTAQEGEASEGAITPPQTIPARTNQESERKPDLSEIFGIKEEDFKSALEEAIKKHLSQNPE